MEQRYRIADFAEALKSIGEGVSKFLDAVPPIGKGVSKFLDALTPIVNANKNLTEAGWLPHYTNGQLALEINDTAALRQAIDQHYRDHWLAIQAQFITRLNTYTIDDETKAVFREALATHKSGHYRATVRLLFPEIERVTRNEFGGWRVKETPDQAGLSSTDPGLKERLKELVLHYVSNKIPIGYHLEDPLSSWVLPTLKLHDHLYKRAETASEIERCEHDPVPNRHAAIHGRVVYSTAQHSINTLIMTECIFHVVTTAKQLARASGDPG
jgi:hypothetical protein